MNLMTCTIGTESLTRLGKFVFVVDRTNTVQWASESLQRLIGRDFLGSNLDSLVTKSDRSLVCLALRIGDEATLQLRGDWLPMADGDSRAFVGSPAPETTEEMTGLGLTCHDFLDSDGWLNYLILSDETLATQEDAVERIQQLKQERSNIAAAHEEMSKTRKATLNMMFDLERTRVAAESANQVKSDFLANMSHEIRTPMTAILGFTDILLSEIKEPEALDAARVVKRNGEQLLRIINDILDISKIEAGKVEMEMIEWSPRQVVAEVISLMHVRASAKGLTLTEEYVGPLPETITTDPTRLRQVLVNLVGNAIKFTETGGVRIVTSLVHPPGDKPEIRFDVIDTGVGISESQIGTVFDAFVQADGSVTRNFGGTGLGLAISRRLARLMGGDISLESEPGKGSSFSVTIAAGSLDGVRLIEYVSDAVVPSEQPVESPRGSEGQLRCRVLLADDIPDNQRLISAILSRAGVEVAIAQNGREAVEKAMAASKGQGKRYSDPAEPFDVILMDVQMPVLDGHEATRRLRSDGYTGPIIALTAHAMRGDRQKCLDAGCDDYLTKPVDHRKLIETVAKWALKRQGKMATATTCECGGEQIQGVSEKILCPSGQHT